MARHYRKQNVSRPAASFISLATFAAKFYSRNFSARIFLLAVTRNAGFFSLNLAGGASLSGLECKQNFSKISKF